MLSQRVLDVLNEELGRLRGIIGQAERELAGLEEVLRNQQIGNGKVPVVPVLVAAPAPKAETVKVPPPAPSGYQTKRGSARAAIRIVLQDGDALSGLKTGEIMQLAKKHCPQIPSSSFCKAVENALQAMKAAREISRLADGRWMLVED